MSKLSKYKEYKKELAIGVAGGFISGGTLLSYQILLNSYGLFLAIIGAVIVAIIMWVIATKAFNKKLNPYKKTP